MCDGGGKERGWTRRQCKHTFSFVCTFTHITSHSIFLIPAATAAQKLVADLLVKGGKRSPRFPVFFLLGCADFLKPTPIPGTLFKFAMLSRYMSEGAL